MEKASRQHRFSPKVLAVILAASLLIILSGILLFRSALSGNVLDTVESGDFRFDLCGNGTLSQIVVYKDGEKTATVKTPSVGSADDHYGVTVTDLNYDGYPDLLVAQRYDGDDRLFAAWLWNHATGTCRSVEALSEVPNITQNGDYRCLVSYTEKRRDVGDDQNGITYYEDAKIYRVFRTVKNEPVEFARYELVYYTKNDIYAYRIFRYDGEENALSTFSEDHWMSPEEAETFSLSAEMSSDMDEHRAEYFPAEAEESTESPLDPAG